MPPAPTVALRRLRAGDVPMILARQPGLAARAGKPGFTFRAIETHYGRDTRVHVLARPGH